MVIPKKDRPPLFFDEHDLERRAYAAYYRKAKSEGYEGKFVSHPGSGGGVAIHDGKVYVVLGGGGNISAVYRLRNDGVLKRLVRIPKAVSDQFE